MVIPFYAQDTLMKLVDEKLPRNLANRVAATLQEMIVHIVGDKKNTTSEIAMGFT